jgi:hypothetical protein
MEPNISSQPTQPAPEIQPLVSQPVSNTPSGKTKYFLFAGVILLILFAVGGAYYLGGINQKSNSQKDTNQKTSITASPTPTPIPTTQTIPASASDTTAGWKTYNNFSVEFSYPGEFTIKESTSGATQNTADFNIGNKEFRFDRFVAPSENEAPYNQTNVTKMFNNNVWKVTQPQTGIAPSYYLYRNGYRYSLTYYSAELKNNIEQILSTLKFTQ